MKDHGTRMRPPSGDQMGAAFVDIFVTATDALPSAAQEEEGEQKYSPLAL